MQLRQFRQGTVSQPNRQVVVFHGRTVKYCLLRSSPCRPDDNNRLESSSKGSSCPAVEFPYAQIIYTKYIYSNMCVYIYIYFVYIMAQVV